MDFKGHPTGRFALALWSCAVVASCSADEASKGAPNANMGASAAAGQLPSSAPSRTPAASPAPSTRAPAMPPSPSAASPAPDQVAMPGPAAPQGNPVPELPAVPDDSAERERMYVINTGDNTLAVIDVVNRKVTTSIALGGKPHGLATSRAGDRVYVTTESPTGEVIAIDPLTDQILWRTQVGASLNEPALSMDDQLLFAPDRDSQRVSVVDVTMQQQVDSIRIALPTLHNAYLSWQGFHVYQTSITGQAIVKINVADRSVERQYAIDGQPRPLQIRSDESKLYAQLSSLNGFIEVDLESGMETARIAWPEPRQLPPGYDPQAKCHGLGLNADNTELWATSSMTSQVHVYSIPALEQVAEIEIGPVPNWMDFTRDGKLVLISSQVPAGRNGQVAVIDTATKQVVSTIEVGRLPKRIHGLVLPE
jgi:YVTN family beta-propeller protein